MFVCFKGRLLPLPDRRVDICSCSDVIFMETCLDNQRNSNEYLLSRKM